MIKNKIIFGVCCVLLVLLPQLTWAAAVKAPEKPDILVYASADKGSKPLFKRPLGYRLIPIFQQQAWLKVGDPKSGETGWVNTDDWQQSIHDYRKSRHNYYKKHHHSESIVMFSESHGDGEHQLSKVDVYKNGKKLGNNDARAWYQKWQSSRQGDAGEQLWPETSQWMSGMIEKIHHQIDDFGYNIS